MLIFNFNYIDPHLKDIKNCNTFHSLFHTFLLMNFNSNCIKKLKINYYIERHLKPKKNYNLLELDTKRNFFFDDVGKSFYRQLEKY